MKTSTFLFTTILSAGLALGMIPSAQAQSPDNRDVVHDTHGYVIRDTLFGNCVRTKWESGDDECYTYANEAVHHREIAEEERTVYFEFNKTRILDSERNKLDSLANALKSMNDIRSVSIVGYADRIGSVGYNDRLSQRRAKVVEEYLHERGYLNTTIAKTRWLGKSDPITHCPSDLKRSKLIGCLQADRRVTVEIEYKNDK